jgi:uncharacterized protein
MKKLMQGIVFLFLALIATLLSLNFSSCELIKLKAMTYTQAHITFSKQSIPGFIQAKLAISSHEKQQGLMDVKELGAMEGMLFMFEKAGRYKFWMKNTYIPLDLIFINKNLEIVGIIENAVPMSLKRLGVDQSYNYVLEINAGLAKKLGLAVGKKSFINFYL